MHTYMYIHTHLCIILTYIYMHVYGHRHIYAHIYTNMYISDKCVWCGYGYLWFSSRAHWAIPGDIFSCHTG